MGTLQLCLGICQCIALMALSTTGTQLRTSLSNRYQPLSVQSPSHHHTMPQHRRAWPSAQIHSKPRPSAANNSSVHREPTRPVLPLCIPSTSSEHSPPTKKQDTCVTAKGPVLLGRAPEMPAEAAASLLAFGKKNAAGSRNGSLRSLPSHPKFTRYLTKDA